MAKVIVKDGDLDYALKRFKKMSEKDGIIEDYKKHLNFANKRERRNRKDFKYQRRK